MPTPTEICNIALGKLGADRISGFENPKTDNEQLCNLFYPTVLHMMLEQRNWTFLVKRVVLSTPEVSTPAWGYGKSFLVPSDFYRVIEVRRNTSDGASTGFKWQLEDSRIVCDVETVYVRYLSSDIPSNQYSGMFVLALATQLAAQMCMQITENRGLRIDLAAEANQLLKDAAAVDGMQGRHEQIHASSLQNARRGGGISSGNF